MNWISVKERLPELDPPYYDEEFKMKIKPLCKEVLICSGDYVVEGYYWPEKKIFSSHFFDEEDVTHWMPLPAPPSKEAGHQ